MTQFWRPPEFWRKAMKGEATEDMKYEHEQEFLSDSGSEEGNEQPADE